MLFDEILKASLDPGRVRYTDGMLAGLRSLGKLITENPRYILSEDMVWVTEQIAESKPTTFTKGLPLCRLPYPTVWLELPYSYRQAYRDAHHPESYYVNIDSDLAPRPASIGFLLEQIDPETIRVTHAWIHHDDVINICYRGMLLHLGTTLVGDPATIKIERRNDEGFHAWADRYTRRPGEEAALNELHCRVQMISIPLMDGYIRDIAKASRGDMAMIERYEELAEFDLIGEWRFCMAALMMLNSRNLLDYQNVDRSKLNRARARNPKKPPALDYRTINLRLPRIARNAARSRGMSNEDLKRHWVTGHPKVRQTGVFWWSPFTRGYRGEAEPPTYRVKP